MGGKTLLDTIQAIESLGPAVRHEKLLAAIEREMRNKYTHLHPQFYPPDCMQAKVSIAPSRGLEMLRNPQPFIRILTDLDFIPHNFRHWPNEHESSADRAQYILINKKIEKIGHKFVLKATLGPNFISVWFRNESRDWRLDIPLFYALEIINKLNDTINNIEICTEGKSQIYHGAKERPSQYSA